MRDFFHLPQLDEYVDRFAKGEPGLGIVAGLDSRRGMQSVEEHPAPTGLLPSGRSAILSILIDQFLTLQSRARCRVVAQNTDVVRISRQFRKRLEVLPVDLHTRYAEQIEAAIQDRVKLLVIDQLDGETIPLSLDAATHGLCVLAPLDTVFHGSGVARHLLDLGAPPDLLPALRWVFCVQRLSTLCSHCKLPALPSDEQLTRLRTHPLLQSDQAGLADLAVSFTARQPPAVFESEGCSQCGQTGRLGEAAIFDVFYNPAQSAAASEVLDRRSVLPVEAYVGRLALMGRLSLDDFLDFNSQQFRRVGYTLLARDAKLAETLAAHERKLAELEAANRVLLQRTRSLVSLQEVGQALLKSEDLKDLASRVCSFAQDLCGADRVIVYYLHSDKQADALAVGGWDPERVPARTDLTEVSAGAARTLKSDEPGAYNHWPPGIPPRHADVEGAELRAGYYLPLVAQGKRVGFILAHTTRRPSFSPKEIALLTTLAQQVALGIQRAGLVDDLRGKIVELEAAQGELRRKERFERDLELGRQVQQSTLPRHFPRIPGFQFAARNEPARQVGGDFYDVIQLDEDHFGVAIGDVSDKGLPAALYMALTRSLLRAEAHRQYSPETVLRNVNQLLLELGDGKSLVTLFYGVVERSSGRMRYSRGGHDRPFLLRAGKAITLAGDGTTLGVFDSDFRLTEEEIPLESGDRLVLYTDGLTDVSAPAGELFGLERLTALLETTAAQPPDRMCETIFARLLEYQDQAEQYDDMSLLIMDVS